MASTNGGDAGYAETPAPATIGLKLEVVTLPVSDVDRAKRFYESLGWRLDADIARRVVEEQPNGGFAGGIALVPVQNLMLGEPAENLNRLPPQIGAGGAHRRMLGPVAQQHEHSFDGLSILDPFERADRRAAH